MDPLFVFLLLTLSDIEDGSCANRGPSANEMIRVPTNMYGRRA